MTREGLPPCVKGVAVFGDNQASWHGTTKCLKPIPVSHRHVVLAGRRAQGCGDNDCSSGALRNFVWPTALSTITDDPDEAAAAYERGAEWVRTGTIS